MEKIRPLIWDGKSLLLLDQRELPQKEEYIQCNSAEDVGEAIRSMVVRGAPAIGVAAAYAMLLAAKHIFHTSPESFLEKLESTGMGLKTVRPTAVNLAWGVEQMLRQAKKLSGSTPQEMLEQLEGLARQLYEEDILVNKRIGEHGASLLPSPCTVLTHCNAGALATAGYGTALGVVRSAFSSGKDIRVIADETRPFLQGARLTAWELQQEGIPVTLIVDSAAGFILSKGHVDCVIVGADRIAANGDVANKIGTYMLAVLARQHNLPFYVAAPLSTFDLSLETGEEIEVENRSAEEITHIKGQEITPPGLEVLNPSFDVTPAHLITAIITEKGVIANPDREKIKKEVTA